MTATSRRRPDRDAWRSALAAAPHDDALRLRYADWLEDQGQGREAAEVREQVRRWPAASGHHERVARCLSVNAGFLVAMWREAFERGGIARDAMVRRLSIAGLMSRPGDAESEVAFWEQQLDASRDARAAKGG